MNEKDWVSPNWRDDAGLVSKVFYKRKFAITPVVCSHGEKVWLKNYYAKYRIWASDYMEDFSDLTGPGHVDFVENISEAEYIVRKISDNL